MFTNAVCGLFSQICTIFCLLRFPCLPNLRYFLVLYDSTCPLGSFLRTATRVQYACLLVLWSTLALPAHYGSCPRWFHYCLPACPQWFHYACLPAHSILVRDQSASPALPISLNWQFSHPGSTRQSIAPHQSQYKWFQTIRHYFMYQLCIVPFPNHMTPFHVPMVHCTVSGSTRQSIAQDQAVQYWFHTI